jgi:hypothetical protein
VVQGLPEYAAWLSRKTGKTYRVLSEAELRVRDTRRVGNAVLVGFVTHDEAGELQR